MYFAGAEMARQRKELVQRIVGRKYIIFAGTELARQHHELVQRKETYIIFRRCRSCARQHQEDEMCLEGMRSRISGAGAGAPASRRCVGGNEKCI